MPEYHINIEIYIDGIYNSETMITAPDHLEFVDVKNLVLSKLHEIKNTLSLGAKLNDHIGQNIILT